MRYVGLPASFWFISFLANSAGAQPVAPAPRMGWVGPMLIPLIIGAIGFIALIGFVIWRMVERRRKRREHHPPHPRA